MNFRPLNNNVLCKKVDSDELKTPSGIIIDTEIKEGDEAVRAEIVAIQDSEDLKVKDIVIFRRNKADAIELDGVDYLIVRIGDIEAKYGTDTA